MPWYEYVCDACGAVTVRRRAVDDRDACPPCDACAGPTHRAVAAPAYVNWGGLPPHRDEPMTPIKRRLLDPARIEADQEKFAAKKSARGEAWAPDYTPN